MINKNDDNWLQVKRFAESELESLREENDNENTDERETQFIRGQIAFAKKILALPEDIKPAPVIKSERYID